MDVKAMSELFSLVIGYAIVAGSVALKLPQIFGIIKSGNAHGVSLFGNIVEGFAIAVTASWGYARELPFRQYGEAVIILAQMAVLILMIGFVSGNGTQLTIAAISLAVIAAAGYALAEGVVPFVVHEALMGVQIIFTLFSRVPQLVMNNRNKRTGALSFTTFFLAFGGSAARALTTAISVPMEKGKLPLLATGLTACVLNGIICLQIVVYGAHGKKHKEQPAAADDAGRNTTGAVRPSGRRAEKEE